MEFFDGTGGYAAGAIDSMIQAGYSPLEIHFSGKPTDKRYFNKRSEMWFQMAEWVKRGGCIPELAILRKELTAPTYTFQNGRFKLEDKEQIKKRLGFSPNYGDALALICFTRNACYNRRDSSELCGAVASRAERVRSIQRGANAWITRRFIRSHPSGRNSTSRIRRWFMG